jgi:hypothetical protein
MTAISDWYDCGVARLNHRVYCISIGLRGGFLKIEGQVIGPRGFGRNRGQ